MENCGILDVIRSRRSVRRYADRPVEQEKVDLLLECACAAPSAANRRPWRFVVIRNRRNLTTSIMMQLLETRWPDGVALAQMVFLVQKEVIRSKTFMSIFSKPQLMSFI